MKYIVKGYFLKNQKKISFSKNIEAPTEKLAKEFVYNSFGSKNKIKRRLIHIEKVEESD